MSRNKCFIIQLRLHREIRQQAQVTKPTILADAMFHEQLLEGRLQSDENTISAVNKIKEVKNSGGKKKFIEFTTLGYPILM